jgi:molybdopterin synthase catalytic subunit
MLHTKIIDIKKEKIKSSNAEDFIRSSKYGASIIFTGTVRNINENKEVTGITLIYRSIFRYTDLRSC